MDEVTAFDASKAFPTHPEHGKRIQMDQRRDGQPCSTDDFLSLVKDAWKRQYFGSDFSLCFERIGWWMRGDFTTAMEGLE